MDESQIRRDRAPRQRLLVIVVLLGVLTFLALPSVVLADDCSSATTGEVNVKDCFRFFPIATLGLFAAAFGALGAGMWAAHQAAASFQDEMDQQDREEKDEEVMRNIQEAMARGAPAQADRHRRRRR